MSLWKNVDTQIGKPKSLALGQIRAMSVLTAGTGYTNGTVGATVSAPAAGGVQATADVTIAGGLVTAIATTNSGAGYISTPTVSVTSGGGSGATFSASFSSTAKNPTGQANLNSAIVFVDFEESQKTSNRIKGIKIPGWYRVFSKVVDGNTRPRGSR